MNKIILSVSRKGDLRFIHNDRLRGLMDAGDATIKRASHVEPGDPTRGQDPLKWYASMVNGPVLGPFNSHQQAIDEEIKWLNEHNLGAPVSTPLSAIPTAHVEILPVV